MNSERIRVLLADDDKDDCLFFQEALEELGLPIQFTAVHDGEQLMLNLNQKTGLLPHALFLDLNLPRKNGIECLTEIKLNSKLGNLFVVIFSTSSEQDLVNLLYDTGAQYYIRKPSEFSTLKKVIYQALAIIREKNFVRPPKEHFVLTGDSLN